RMQMQRSLRSWKAMAAVLGLLGVLVVAGCVTVGAPEVPTEPDTGTPAPAAEAGHAYEVWAIDQGHNQIHIYSPDLEELDVIDLAAEGVELAHMIDFTSDFRYA